MLKAENRKLKEDYDLTMQKMKQLTKDVVKPLIEQVTLRENALLKKDEEQKIFKKNLKMLNAVVRSPILSDLYAKRDQKIMSAKQLADQKKEAAKLLGQYNVNEQNADKFIEELYDSVRQSLQFKTYQQENTDLAKDQKRNQSPEKQEESKTPQRRISSISPEAQRPVQS